MKILKVMLAISLILVTANCAPRIVNEQQAYPETTADQIDTQNRNIEEAPDKQMAKLEENYVDRNAITDLLQTNAEGWSTNNPAMVISTWHPDARVAAGPKGEGQRQYSITEYKKALEKNIGSLRDVIYRVRSLHVNKDQGRAVADVVIDYAYVEDNTGSIQRTRVPQRLYFVRNGTSWHIWHRRY